MFASTSKSASIYTLRGRTQFTVSANCALQYSYIDGRTDYVEGRLLVAVAHQLNDAMDVGGSIGRGRLNYRESVPTGGSETPVTYPDENQFTSGIGLGYRRRRTRVGFRVDFFSRDGDTSDLGGYSRTRAFSTMTYTF